MIFAKYINSFRCVTFISFHLQLVLLFIFFLSFVRVMYFMCQNNATIVQHNESHKKEEEENMWMWFWFS